jgi:phospholipid/cholesterol/gamma-HCH transport system substrate-binding protein
MDDRVLRLRVGVVVLAAALITAFLVARFGDLPLPGTGTYTIYVRFPNAPGVTPGTPVRRSGVQIGRVSNVVLKEPRGVQVELEIDRNRKIEDVDAAWITSASMLGDPVIEFVSPDPIPPGAKPIEDGVEIVNGQVMSNPLDTLSKMEPQLQQTLISVQRAGIEFEQAARNFNTAIGNNQDQLPRVAQKAERALDQFNITMTNLNGIFDDPQTREDLRRVLRDFPQFMDDARQTLGKADSAFDSLKQASDSATQNMENLQNFTKPLGERGPAIVDNIDGSVANINALLEELVTFTDQLNSREGTLGRILYDDAIYQRLDRVLANAEDITAKIKPILGDARIISDKLARDPGQLGLRGLLDRRPIGVGTKGTPTTRGSLSSYGGEDCFEPLSVEGNAYDPVIVP